jgi:hypothetical protein
MRTAASLLAVVGLLVVSALAENTDPSQARVQLLIRSPDDKPLANARIILTPPEAHGFETKRSPVTATTDAEGMATFDIAPGVTGFSVSVSGIGYTNIGITEFVAGQTIKPHVSALAPYGSIEGDLPAGLFRRIRG